MSKISFDIKYRPQIESGEYKVVTDVGEPVEVVKWDCKGKCPILAVIDDGDTQDSCFYDENGVSYSGKECIYILTNELELTEFERELDSCVENIQNSYGDDRKRNIRFYADTLLEIARKQLESEFQQAYESGKATAERIDKSAQEWYEKGKQDALKDMPKWKRPVTDIAQYEDACIIYEYRSGTDFSRNVPVLKCGLMQVDIEELKNKLPKEE